MDEIFVEGINLIKITNNYNGVYLKLHAKLIRIYPQIIFYPTKSRTSNLEDSIYLYNFLCKINLKYMILYIIRFFFNELNLMVTLNIKKNSKINII